MKELEWHHRDALLSMATLRRAEQLCDVALVFEEETTVFAHKVVLAAVSTFFRAILTDPVLGNTTTLKVKGVSAQVGCSLIDFSYLGSLDVHGDNAALFLEAAEKLGFHQVEKMCVELLRSEKVCDASSSTLCSRQPQPLEHPSKPLPETTFPIETPTHILEMYDVSGQILNPNVVATTHSSTTPILCPSSCIGEGRSPPDELDSTEISFRDLYVNEVAFETLQPAARVDVSSMPVEPKRNETVVEKVTASVVQPRDQRSNLNANLSAVALPIALELPTSLDCAECGATFSKVAHLKKHWTRHHRIQAKLPCPECGKAFKKTHLGVHVKRVHRGVKETPRPCPDCGKLYIRNALRVHRRRDHMGLRYACDECPSDSPTVLTTAILLRRHKESVHRRRRFRCTVCGSEFVDKSSWRKHHEAAHEGLRYACHVCAKEFTRPTDRDQHVDEVHYGRRWNCSLCPKSYSQSNNLRIHVKSVHMGVHRHVCSVCGKGFPRPSTLNEHVVKEHS